MSGIRWLTRHMVEAFHRESLTRFGGVGGLRDAAGLESALARPRHLAAYGDAPNLFALAAAYGFGIIRNHPFVDGSKRAGLLAGRVFLALNGYRFEPDEAVTVAMIQGLAAGEVDEAALADWLAGSSAKVG